MSKWHLIENRPLREEIYKDSPLLSYRKGRSLKDFLIRANIFECHNLSIQTNRSRVWPVNIILLSSCLAYHHYFTSMIWLNNPRYIPVVTARDFTKFHIPPPLSFEFEKISRIFPYPGAENLIHPLYSPTYSPGWPGVLPLGEADDMCIIASMGIYLHLLSSSSPSRKPCFLHETRFLLY